MAEILVVPKRIGGSLAVFIPADLVREEGIEPGVPVRITVKRRKVRVLGYLKGRVPYEPFDRHKEGFWPAD
jgi:hypothetical protein